MPPGTVKPYAAGRGNLPEAKLAGIGLGRDAFLGLEWGDGQAMHRASESRWRLTFADSLGHNHHATSQRGERRVNKDGRWNGLLGLIVVIVACLHASFWLVDVSWRSLFQPLMLVQASLIGMWIAGGAARWWVRGLLLLALYPCLYGMAQLTYNPEKTLNEMTSVFLVSIMVFSIAQLLARICLHELQPPGQFSILRMMLLVSFCFALCVVWGRATVDLINNIVTFFRWSLVAKLSIFSGVPALAAFPALFQLSRYQKYVVAAACMLIGIFPWAVLILAWLMGDEILFFTNLWTWGVAIVVAVTIYPLQAIRRPNGEPYCRIFQPIDCRPEDLGKESTLEKSESQVAVSDHDRVTTDVP